MSDVMFSLRIWLFNLDYVLTTNQLMVKRRSDVVASLRGGVLEARRPIAGFFTILTKLTRRLT